jgi:hypothetical protein
LFHESAAHLQRRRFLDRVEILPPVSPAGQFLAALAAVLAQRNPMWLIPVSVDEPRRALGR